MLLDEDSLKILKSFKRKNWLYESEDSAPDATEEQSNNTSLKDGDEAYDNLKTELGEQLKDVPLSLEYFRYTRPSSGEQAVIEVSGTLQDNVNFIYKYGLDDGVFINVNNFKMKDSTAESLRIIYIYYNTKFQEICKHLIEA